MPSLCGLTYPCPAFVGTGFFGCYINFFSAFVFHNGNGTVIISFVETYVGFGLKKLNVFYNPYIFDTISGRIISDIFEISV